MARPQTVFLTAAVAMVIGVAIGVIGLSAVTTALNPSAQEVANQLDEPAPKPQVYGER